ncbi:MAG: hypothetical protein U1F06_10685 [Steroidobacteraceae bacterium]
MASDAVGNLRVRVPATPGRGGAAPVVLQGHLDMVCERNAGGPHDPEQGRIHVGATASGCARARRSAPTTASASPSPKTASCATGRSNC